MDTVHRNIGDIRYQGYIAIARRYESTMQLSAVFSRGLRCISVIGICVIARARGGGTTAAAVAVRQRQ